jgi:hypothetical protein
MHADRSRRTGRPEQVGQRSEPGLRDKSGACWIDWLVLLLACAALFLGSGVGAQSAAAAGPKGPATPGSKGGIVGWIGRGSDDENTLSAGEGVATVFPPHLGRYELYRGIQSVPSSLAAQGWTHIGDPDSVDGYLFDAYQGPSSGSSKMFLVTTPSGDSFEYLHTLVPSELYNNSFATISPDRQWMVAGEWGTMRHLQIYPTPLLNHKTSADGGSLRLAGYIKLDHRVNDIQGCDFVTPARLICASDDDSRTLFPNEKPLLEINLPRTLQGNNVSVHVVDLGSIPQESSCSGTFEAEGVDFDPSTGILRVEVIQPGSCILHTTVYEYARAGTRG